MIFISISKNRLNYECVHLVHYIDPAQRGGHYSQLAGMDSHKIGIVEGIFCIEEFLGHSIGRLGRKI